MNNFEIECLDFIGELFTNRPKDINGKDTTYTDEDYTTLLNCCNEKKRLHEENLRNRHNNSYQLLLQLYDIVLELLKHKII